MTLETLAEVGDNPNVSLSAVAAWHALLPSRSQSPATPCSSHFLHRALGHDPDAMKTVVILSTASGYGGAERSVEIMARHLPPGVQVRIYASHRLHLSQLAGIRAPNLQVLRMLPGGGGMVRKLNALRLAFDVWRWRPTAVLVNTRDSALLAAMAARLRPALGAITHLYVRDFQWTDLRFIFRRLPGVQVLVPSRVVIGRTGYLTPFFVEPLGAAQWVELPDMVELPEAASPCANGPVLHLAAMNRWKGHVDLVLTLLRLKAAGRSVKILSHGPPDDAALRAELDALIDRLDMGDAFVLGDYVADPVPLLRACSAVVVSSTTQGGGPETFGRAVIEAWAFRRPVVAYAAGAPALLVEHEVDGLLVPEGDTAALADALWRLQTEPGLARRLGEAGRAKVEARFEARAVSERLYAQLGVGGDSH